MSVRLVVRTFSELCITAGALIILFVVYFLFWTGVKAADAAEGEIDTLQSQWAREPVAQAPPPGSAEASPSKDPAPYRAGKPFATMHIPRFGADWEWPVLENTAVTTLQKGLGHYSGTARPGDTGNFAVAGHRRTYGDPFKDFPKLRPGDAVVVNDGTTWFTYRVAKKPYRTVPTDTAVVDPVPAARIRGRRTLSDAHHVRAGMGQQPPADRLGASGRDTAGERRKAAGAFRLTVLVHAFPQLTPCPAAAL